MGDEEVVAMRREMISLGQTDFLYCAKRCALLFQCQTKVGDYIIAYCLQP
jgi:hypothetical protein